jgi:hypothetical protein
MAILDTPEPAPSRRRPLAAAIVVVLLALGGLLLWRPWAPAARRPGAAASLSPRPSAAPSLLPSVLAPRPSAARPAPRASAAAPTVAAPAPLHVEADVADASVFVDQRFVGKAPLDIRDVTPGSHRVHVSAEGFEMQAEDVVIGDAPVSVSARFREVRLDESIEVIHRHGLGSCRGTLRATPGAIAFAAAGGKDSFEAPRANLRPLEVDYLKKNLRISTTAGRTWNFTTDAANADALLVFQQKTAKAFARLAP